MAKDNYFVRIQNPKQARKVILENTRDILRVLQGYEDFKKVRERKTGLVNSFRNNVEEIRSFVVEAKRMLPKTNLKEVRRPSPQAVQKPVKEIKRIEEELADIEAKLSEL